MATRSQTNLPFALVLSGGGARGLAHAGVLRALEHEGYLPSAVVGVSMGAIVAVTYGLNPDWYRSLVEMDTKGFPRPYVALGKDWRERARASIAFGGVLRDMLLGWGVGNRALPLGKRLLRDLTLDRNLEDSRLPVAVVATDLLSGQRVVLENGNAAEVAYASSALAGILPPLPWKDMLLADGAYADVAPTDIARTLVPARVIAVDAGLPLDPGVRLGNGLQALSRALEICHARHAHLLFEQADLILRPDYRETIDTLDFDSKRPAVAAGIRAVRSQRSVLARLLAPQTGTINDTSATSSPEEPPNRRRAYADGIIGDLIHGERQGGTEQQPRLPATSHLPAAEHLETAGQHVTGTGTSRA